MIKVAITDDHPLILEGITRIISRHPQFQLIGSWKNGDELLQGITIEQPDVLLLDIQMPGKSGIELAEYIHKNYKKTGILALTSVDILPQVKKMLQYSLGYLLKDSEENIIVAAIESVARKEEYLDLRLRERLVAEMFKVKKSGEASPLSRREKEILKLIAAGMTAPEIAKSLFISARTVENHRNNIIQKLQVKNAVEMVRIAMQNGLLD